MGINVEQNPKQYLQPRASEWLRAELEGADKETLDKIAAEAKAAPLVAFMSIPVTKESDVSATVELLAICNSLEGLLVTDYQSDQNLLAKRLSEALCAILSLAEARNIDLREQLSLRYEDALEARMNR